MRIKVVQDTDNIVHIRQYYGCILRDDDIAPMATLCGYPNGEELEEVYGMVDCPACILELKYLLIVAKYADFNE